ncbi:ndufa6 NADH-ubiquinone oxidoreductase subunit [Tilletia horrida]|nr:ndufa6 NADH-ubiquinone oxidoreductase subunit [Tilletia horrida]
MTTIPTRFAQAAKVSSNLFEAHARSRALYRQFYRSAPEICALYALDVPPSLLRAKIRTQFEKYRGINDLAVLDVLLLKAQQEYQETINAWKQLPQIMRWFADEEADPKPQTFLENFYAGRDEPKSV